MLVESAAPLYGWGRMDSSVVEQSCEPHFDSVAVVMRAFGQELNPKSYAIGKGVHATEFVVFSIRKFDQAPRVSLFGDYDRDFDYES